MPTLAAPSYLSRNLDCLGRRNADLAAKLAATAPRSDVTRIDSADGVPSLAIGDVQLCSKVHPLKEAARLTDSIDLIEHAVVVVLGFAAGWHVKALADRGEKSTLFIVYEPDLALLRATLEVIDHSSWLRDALVIFITDSDDRGALAAKLAGAEAILGQGVHVLEHPASRHRLGDAAMRFSKNFAEQVAAARTTLATTLMRSVDTTRNLIRNIDHYVAGPGIADLEGAAAGWPAVVVSAGPSLHRNMMLLAKPGIRDRCVIIAVQTALKPLLDAGITPHFVTALDFHEISRRFYEELNATALRDVTLIAEPKVHPVVLDMYPGPVRCCSNGFLDRALGPAAKPMGDLPAGATVAHLAMYVARHLGCDPVAMIGQDLGFPDGLYYAPHAVIHVVWAPELNPFNTIAMMEWQRIARHRLHLKKTQDVHGRPIFTDAQMHTYLQQFERDFSGDAKKGLTTIDASEGGVRKQHTIAMPLREFLQNHATKLLPDLPQTSDSQRADAPSRLRAAANSIASLRTRVVKLESISRDTDSLLTQMLEHQRDPIRMAALFKRVDAHRTQVQELMDAFDLLNIVNQMGAFRRMKADRRLQMSSGMGELTVQRRQLERDLENVRWLADAAKELASQLDQGIELLNGQPSSHTSAASQSQARENATERCSTIAALMAIDPTKNGRGIVRSLEAPFGHRSVLQATLERLGESQTIGSIVLIAPSTFDVDGLIDRSRIGVPVEIERCEGESPFGPEHEAIAVARAFADTCWRGGIAGMSIYDEALCPQAMSAVMQRRSLTAALIVAPDWPLIDVTGEAGCDAVVRRHLEHPKQNNLVFTQAPPGLCGCVMSAALMSELAQRNRLSTVGGLLVYQPHAPQHDPIARDACVQIPHALKRSLSRATFDSKRWRMFIDPRHTTIDHLESACSKSYCEYPQHLTLELTPQRTSRGVFARSLHANMSDRETMAVDQAIAIIEQVAANSDDLTLTLHGSGDPLLHPHFDSIIASAKRAGFAAVNIRTELLCDSSTLDRLLASGVDVISVDLNADRAVTYVAMMGVDRFKEVLINMEHLFTKRRRLTSQTGNSAFALPWVVPHLQRRAETYEDIDTFFDRWQHMLGTAVIEDPPASDPRPIGLTPAVTPSHVLQRESLRRMTILSDGSVPTRNGEFTPCDSAGSTHEHSITELWQRLLKTRTHDSAERTS